MPAGRNIKHSRNTDIAMALYFLAVSGIHFTYRILLDILNSSTKEHEEKGVLEKDETESSTDVMMGQMEGFLTGK